MYAEICPDCGAYLDPGERCNCEDDAEPPPQDGESPCTQRALIAG